MSRSSLVLSSLATVVIVELSLFLYLSTEELKLYKKEAKFGIQSNNTVVHGQSETSKKNRQLVILANSKDSKNIQIASIINEYAKKIEGDISIYFKNLATEESVVIDGDKKYYMASLYKVILTLFLLDEVEKGNTTLGTQVGTSSATLKFALEKIITESNNEYAETLAAEYGWKTIEKKMKEKLGIEFDFSEKLEVSLENIGILFENIALAKNVKDSERNYMLRLLKDQKLKNKLPKYLPTSVRSHNKTGELEGYSHDAGIFYTPKANYVLAFMSKTDDPKLTNEQMALMSKEIYESLNETTF